jgi:hypothetical protein
MESTSRKRSADEIHEEQSPAKKQKKDENAAPDWVLFVGVHPDGDMVRTLFDRTSTPTPL